MSYDGEGLASVEARIDGWRADPLLRPQLDNEVGTYLGSVILASVSGAAWTVTADWWGRTALLGPVG